MQLLVPPHHLSTSMFGAHLTLATSSPRSLAPPPVLAASRPRSKSPPQICRFFNLHVPAEEDPGKDHYSVSGSLLEALASLLDCPVHSLPSAAFSVVRKSFDARKNTKGTVGPKFVYTVDLHLHKLPWTYPEQRRVISHLHTKRGKVAFLPSDKKSDDVISLVEHSKSECNSKLERKDLSKDAHGNIVLKHHTLPKVIVVGSGPAGLFAALVLAESGARVTLIERGQPVESRGRDIGSLMVRRVLQPDSNFSYGEGGAGTWSDGKLTTQIGRNRGSVQTVLETLVKFGAPPHILIDGKPHIGTDKLIHILRRFRGHLHSLGVDLMFGTKMVDLLITGRQVSGVHVTCLRNNADLDKQKLASDMVVLAVGHSARDVYSKLLEHNVLITPKDFSVGFRVEHPQDLINEIQYNNWASEVQRGRGKIPVADYKVTTNVKSDWSNSTKQSAQYGCYSFCMCPGGQIVPTSTNPNELCINGMSFSKRSSKWANAAIVLTVSSSELKPFVSEHGPLAGVAFQRLLEKEAAVMGGGNMVAPVQIVPDFLDNRLSGCSLPSSSYRLGVREAPLHTLFPQYLTEMFKEALINFNKQIPGFIDRHALLHAVETRTSSPLRIDRDGETFESVSLPGLYPVGEGAGYAGGIVSAAVDGMHAGFALAKKLGLCDDVLGQLRLVDKSTY